MLSDASGFRHVYLFTGYTDLRKGIDGLIAYSNAFGHPVHLFLCSGSTSN